MDTNVKTIIERTPCVSDNDEIYHNTSEETNTFTLMISVNRNDKKDIEVMGGTTKFRYPHSSIMKISFKISKGEKIIIHSGEGTSWYSLTQLPE